MEKGRVTGLNQVTTSASKWRDSPELFLVISLHHLLKTGKCRYCCGTETLKIRYRFSFRAIFTILNSKNVMEFGLFSHNVGLHNQLTL